METGIQARSTSHAESRYGLDGYVSPVTGFCPRWGALQTELNRYDFVPRKPLRSRLFVPGSFPALDCIL
jgi:hypothetical protein